MSGRVTGAFAVAQGAIESGVSLVTGYPAVQLGVRMLVLILDNGTTALSGGQPHPGSHLDVRGEPRSQVDLEKLVRATGVNSFHAVDLDRREDIQPAIEAGMANDGVSVVIAKGECIFF